jgi:hypothetical protein
VHHAKGLAYWQNVHGKIGTKATTVSSPFQNELHGLCMTARFYWNAGKVVDIQELNLPVGLMWDSSYVGCKVRYIGQA